MNQVEIWFSILARRLLKRASFTSLEDLRTRAIAGKQISDAGKTLMMQHRALVHACRSAKEKLLGDSHRRPSRSRSSDRQARRY